MLIILHGLLGMSDNWMTLAKSLSEKFTVIIPDLRNHGNSPHSMEFTMNIMVNDIAMLIRNLNINNVNMMGHSMGGRIAMQLAVHSPELLNSLICVDAAPRKYPPNTYIFNLLKIMNDTDTSKISSLTAAEKILKDKVKEPKVVNLLLKNLKHTNNGGFLWKPNVQSVLDNFDYLMPDFIPGNAFVKPCLFIKGEYSDFIQSSDLKLISNYFPAYELIEISGAGHWVHVDAPKAFLKIVNDFQTKVNPSI